MGMSIHIALLLFLTCATPALSTRVHRNTLCPTVDLNFANLVNLNNDLNTAIASWDGANLTKLHKQTGTWKKSPFFTLTGSTFSSIQRECNKLKGNLIEVYSPPELTILNRLMRNHNLKSTLFNLRYDTVERVPKWPIADTIFFFTDLDTTIETNKDIYKGYLKYVPPPDVINAIGQLVVLADPQGITAICVQKPSLLSAKVQDLQTKIASDLEKFTSRSPNATHLLHNILSLNGISKASLSLPTASDHCMRVLIQTAGHINFDTVTYIKDEETFFSTFKTFDTLITNVNTFYNHLTKINVMASTAPNLDLTVCLLGASPTISQQAALIIASLVIFSTSLIALIVCLACRLCKHSCRTPSRKRKNRQHRHHPPNAPEEFVLYEPLRRSRRPPPPPPRKNHLAIEYFNEDLAI